MVYVNVCISTKNLKTNVILQFCSVHVCLSIRILNIAAVLG